MSSIATLTVELNRSPKIRISGPVMLTTEGFRASASVLRIASPRPSAADSLTSGDPFRIPSRNMIRIGAIPYDQRQTILSQQNKTNL